MEILSSSASTVIIWSVILAVLIALVVTSSSTSYVDKVRQLWNERRRRSRKQKITYQSPICRTKDTVNSGSLEKLPPEVRLQIYEYAIGHRLLHVVKTDSGIERFVCHAENNAVSLARLIRIHGSKIQSRRLSNAAVLGGISIVERNFELCGNLTGGLLTRVQVAWYHPCWKRAVRKGDPLLPLLLTCRHIYSESVEVLYTSNTFHFLRPSDFLSFVDSVPRFEASLLRSIKLYVNPTAHSADMLYVAAWSVLTSLPLLKELRLLIAPSVMTREVWKLHEAQLLEPIKSFDHSLKVFDLFLSVFPEWIDPKYQAACHVRPIKEMTQLQGAHLSRYS